MNQDIAIEPGLLGCPTMFSSVQRSQQCEARTFHASDGTGNPAKQAA
jgi:hypothetical protein